MTCYHPLDAAWKPGSGKPAIIYKNGQRPKKLAPDYEALQLPCGKCIGCRLDKTSAWAMRMMHEAQMHDDNCFITLTYETEPHDGSLNKKHFQDFIKRLRKKIWPQKLRYYQCGEYGEKLRRPHYHAILFGYDFQDKEILSNKNGCRLYTSQMLAETWGLGFVTLSEVTFDTCAYVARYVTKKITGSLAQDHYLRFDEYGTPYWLEPEYSTQSLKPGIGHTWYEKYKTDVFPRDETPIPGRGVFKKVPRYYDKLLKASDKITHDEVTRLREKFREAHGQEYLPGRLESKEKVALAKMALNKRTLEEQ